MTNRSQKLFQLGQSLWYDNIQRRLLENGELAGMIERGEIYGVTSNPSIFNNAIAKSKDYDDDLIPLVEAGMSPMEAFEVLAVEDIRAAADLFKTLYEETDGGDGYVSLEVNPDLAHDTEATFEEASRLWDLVDRPNLMIKIPATKAGLPAVQQSISAGINVNVTLIFSIDRYVEVMEAYLVGLEARLAAGGQINDIASVASFFISRIDSKVDGWLDEVASRGGEYAELANSLKGKIAIANAKFAFQRFKDVFETPRFEKLRKAGGNLQRPLWASTSTKNPNYPDVLYVDQLIGPNTVNTVPPETLSAFLDHGVETLTLEDGIEDANRVLETFAQLGLSLDNATQELEDEGVQKFSDAFAELLAGVQKKMEQLAK
ncbi:transaldolase [Chloroflexota bacterium]